MECHGISVKISFQLKLSKVFFIESSKIQHLLDMRLQRLCKEDNPKIDCPCINLPYSGSQKLMVFAQNVFFSLENVGLKQDKASLNTLQITIPQLLHSSRNEIFQGIAIPTCCTVNFNWLKVGAPLLPKDLCMKKDKMFRVGYFKTISGHSFPTTFISFTKLRLRSSV